MLFHYMPPEGDSIFSALDGANDVDRGLLTSLPQTGRETGEEHSRKDSGHGSSEVFSLNKN